MNRKQVACDESTRHPRRHAPFARLAFLLLVSWTRSHPGRKSAGNDTAGDKCHDGEDAFAGDVSSLASVDGINVSSPSLWAFVKDRQCLWFQRILGEV